ncbi:MAG: PAS domain-containing sensor histidine kinase [Acidimicrobiia bacterium]|nr:PAS domain-containing sensor histidine kinase [Acidimicrobiia bacterium]
MTEFEDLGPLFERMPVALYRSAPSGELLAANPALAQLLGYDSVEDLFAGVSSVVSVYVGADRRRQWIDAIESDGTVFDFDVELRRADGSTVWVQDTARAVRDDRGAVRYYEGALIDVTEKVKARRAKDQFVATVSHELRNPIAVVLGLSDELANNYDSFDDADRRDMARLVARQADDASWIIEDLLVAYRDEIDDIVVAEREFDVTKEAERVLEVVDHPIEVRISGSEPRVIADPRRTRQILRNLISNALRYGGDDVNILVRQAADRIEVMVCDNGERIPDSEVERIFRPFERAGEGHPSGSIGLGLSVARRLARLMGGDLTYRYVEGRSCFVLSLPSA